MALLQGGKRGHIKRILLLLGAASGQPWDGPALREPSRGRSARPGLRGASEAVNLLPSGHDEAEGEIETSPLGTSVIVGEGAAQQSVIKFPSEQPGR